MPGFEQLMSRYAKRCFIGVTWTPYERYRDIPHNEAAGLKIRSYQGLFRSGRSQTGDYPPILPRLKRDCFAIPFLMVLFLLRLPCRLQWGASVPRESSKPAFLPSICPSPNHVLHFCPIRAIILLDHRRR